MSEPKSESGITLAMKFVFAIAASVLCAVVMRDLYFWFAVPLGAPFLSLAHLYGIVLLKGLFVGRLKTDNNPDLFSIYVYTLLVWGLGAIAASFMP